MKRIMDVTAAAAERAAVVLVDPVSSGRLYKDAVIELGFKLVAIFTLSHQQLEAAGKGTDLTEKLASCDAHIHSSEAEEVTAFLQALPYEIAAILPASEPAVELADLLAARFGVVGNDPLTSLHRRDKTAMRQSVQAAGLDGPQYKVCRSREQAIDFADGTAFPLILKAPKGAGAHHVISCSTVDDVLEAYERISTTPDIFGYLSGSVLAEEYIPGPQYVAEFVACDGHLKFAFLWRLSFEMRGDVECFHQIDLVSSPSTFPRAPELIDYARKSAAAVGVRWGPCIVEIRDHPARGPLLIEVGARLSGIDLPALSKIASSRDIVRRSLEVYLGQPEEDAAQAIDARHASLVLCRTADWGIVESIDGIEEIVRLPSYVSHKLTVEAGDELRADRDLASIPLYLYLSHASEKQLAEDAALARQMLSVKFQARG